MKRFLTVFLLVAMLMNLFAFTAYAEVENSTRASEYFDYYGIRLSDQGNGRIKIVFSCGGTGVCDSLGVATYEVEKRNDNGDWVDVTSLLSGRTASEVSSYTFSKYFNGVEGETYRVQCTFTCTINNGTEHKGYTSGSITA